MNITRLPSTIRNLSRLYEIAKVIYRHGFGDLADRLGLGSRFATFKQAVSFGRWGEGDAATSQLRWEERVRLVFEELGSTFIKLGQILATRPDLIPMTLVHELRKLQDNVPPFGADEAAASIEEELGAKIADLFQEFGKEPLAAASIAQVHKAVLMNGDKVVVKVQRPGLKRRIGADLDLLHLLAELAEERLPELRRWQPVAIVEEFDRSIHKEIDFNREAHNIRRFAKNFEGDPGVYCPRVYDDLCTERVLVMEFIDGVKMTSENIKKLPDVDPETVVRHGVRCILTQVFVHGFFHADPHPGNVFVMAGNVICLLDFGMMGSLDQERIDDLLGFLVAVLTNNPERMIRQFLKQGLIDERVDTRGLKSDLADLMDRYFGVQVSKIDVALYIQQLFDVITRHRIVLPSDLLLMGKSLATIDGIARDVCPDLDPIQAIRPQILSIYFRRLTDPEYYTRDTRRALEDAALLAQQLPRRLRVIVQKLEAGELRVKWCPDGEPFERMLRDKSRASNRLAAAVAIGGLAAVSSYLVVSIVNSPGFHLADGAMTPGGKVLFTLSVVGYALSTFLGLGFFWGMFRSGGQ